MNNSNKQLFTILSILLCFSFAYPKLNKKLCKSKIGKPGLTLIYDSSSIEIYSIDFCWYNCRLDKENVIEESSFMISNDDSTLIVTNVIEKRMHNNLILKYGGIKEYIGKFTGNPNYKIDSLGQNNKKYVLHRISGCTAKEITILDHGDSVSIHGINKSECPQLMCGSIARFGIEENSGFPIDSVVFKEYIDLVKKNKENMDSTKEK